MYTELLCVVCVLGIIVAREELTASVYLVGSMIMGAISMSTWGGEMVSVLYVLVYVGAIAVLIVFVVMIIGTSEAKREEREEGLGLGTLAAGTVLDTDRTEWVSESGGESTRAARLSEVLYSTYSTYVTVGGVVLLVAMVASLRIVLEDGGSDGYSNA